MSTYFNSGADIVSNYQDEPRERLLILLENWINTAAQESRNADFWRNRSGLLADYIYCFKYGGEPGDVTEFERDARRLEIYAELNEFSK